MELKAAGQGSKNILKHGGGSLKTVNNVLKSYGETGSTSTKPIPGRKRSARTKRLVEIVSKAASVIPQCSMRKMAKHL